MWDIERVSCSFVCHCALNPSFLVLRVIPMSLVILKKWFFHKYKNHHSSSKQYSKKTGYISADAYFSKVWLSTSEVRAHKFVTLYYYPYYRGDKVVNSENLGWQICEQHVGIVVKSAHQLKGSQICHPVARIFNIYLLIIPLIWITKWHGSAEYFWKRNFCLRCVC